MFQLCIIRSPNILEDKHIDKAGETVREYELSEAFLDITTKAQATTIKKLIGLYQN